MEISDEKSKNSSATLSLEPSKNKWSHKPQLIICQNCDYKGFSKCEYDSGFIAWLVCGTCILVGCVFGCCMCPFCIAGLKICTHICPHCNKVVGAHYPGKV
ncbi:unnamed protein product [Blepharisma stoltei]|uniref:LITAF domain-containing protein n=1 Tax=Blepharisma stoltei TaxID=1481888 RepID=A0AAU9JZI1_9CILI|nr:unnamed protein product [Blepharisma stoltei]